MTDDEVIAMLQANIGQRIVYMLNGTIPVEGTLAQCGDLGRDVLMVHDEGGCNVLPYIHNITLKEPHGRHPAH